MSPSPQIGARLLVAMPSDGGDGRGDEDGSASGAREPTRNAIGKAVATVAVTSPKARTGLAHPARSGQRQEPDRLIEQQGTSRGALCLPGDEAGAWDGRPPSSGDETKATTRDLAPGWSTDTTTSVPDTA